MTAEQVAKPEEQPKPASVEEKAKDASTESKDATLDITKTEEFKKAQSGWDKQITLSKAETQKATAETEKLQRAQESSNASFAKLEAAHEKLLGEQDSEALEGYRRTKSEAALKAERELWDAKRVAQAFDIEEDKKLLQLTSKAIKLAQGDSVLYAELEACQTEREMELVVKAYQKPKEEETPPVDLAISTATGDKTDAQKLKERYPTMK